VEAAELLRRAGDSIDAVTYQDLAYTLYAVCGRRGWTAAGSHLNALGAAFPDLVELAWAVADPDPGAAGGGTGAVG
jgi:hypothetical protein